MTPKQTDAEKLIIMHRIGTDIKNNILPHFNSEKAFSLFQEVEKEVANLVAKVYPTNRDYDNNYRLTEDIMYPYDFPYNLEVKSNLNKVNEVCVGGDVIAVNKDKQEMAQVRILEMRKYVHKVFIYGTKETDWIVIEDNDYFMIIPH